MNLNNTINAYEAMLGKLDEIERALDITDFSSTEKLKTDIESYLECMRIEDNQLNQQEIASRQSLIIMVLKKNNSIVRRIQAITALQQNELKQINQGRKTAKGYCSNHQSQTGGLINSSQ